MAPPRVQPRRWAPIRGAGVSPRPGSAGRGPREVAASRPQDGRHRPHCESATCTTLGLSLSGPPGTFQRPARRDPGPGGRPGARRDTWTGAWGAGRAGDRSRREVGCRPPAPSPEGHPSYTLPLSGPASRGDPGEVRSLPRREAEGPARWLVTPDAPRPSPAVRHSDGSSRLALFSTSFSSDFFSSVIHKSSLSCEASLRYFVTRPLKASAGNMTQAWTPFPRLLPP